jgi:DNA-binding protein HU-beta
MPEVGHFLHAQAKNRHSVGNGCHFFAQNAAAVGHAPTGQPGTNHVEKWGPSVYNCSTNGWDSYLTMILCVFYDNLMHKQDFIHSLAKKNRRPQKFYEDALTEILTGLKEELAKGKSVTFLGFGSFYTRLRKPGTGRNFKTNERITIPEVRLVDFRPGKLLKQAVRTKSQAGTKQTKKSLLKRFLH